MLERLEQRSLLLALRDATAVSVQYGLAMRNQEIWALTLGDVASRRATVREVLSYGALDVGKTEGATGRTRRPPIDALLADDIAFWAAALAAHGYPAGADDFLLRGDLGGHGAPDGHMTGSQAHQWPRKYFTPAVRKGARRGGRRTTGRSSARPRTRYAEGDDLAAHPCRGGPAGDRKAVRHQRRHARAELLVCD